MQHFIEVEGQENKIEDSSSYAPGAAASLKFAQLPQHSQKQLHSCYHSKQDRFTQFALGFGFTKDESSYLTIIIESEYAEQCALCGGTTNNEHPVIDSDEPDPPLIKLFNGQADNLLIQILDQNMLLNDKYEIVINDEIHNEYMNDNMQQYIELNDILPLTKYSISARRYDSEEKRWSKYCKPVVIVTDYKCLWSKELHGLNARLTNECRDVYCKSKRGSCTIFADIKYIMNPSRFKEVTFSFRMHEIAQLSYFGFIEYPMDIDKFKKNVSTYFDNGLIVKNASSYCLGCSNGCVGIQRWINGSKKGIKKTFRKRDLRLKNGKKIKNGDVFLFHINFDQMSCKVYVNKKSKQNIVSAQTNGDTFSNIPHNILPAYSHENNPYVVANTKVSINIENYVLRSSNISQNKPDAPLVNEFHSAFINANKENSSNWTPQNANKKYPRETEKTISTKPELVVKTIRNETKEVEGTPSGKREFTVTGTKAAGLNESDLQLMMSILQEHAYPEMENYFQKRNMNDPLKEHYEVIGQYFTENGIDNNKFTSVTKTSFVQNVSSFIGENSHSLKQSLGQLYTVINTNHELNSVLSDLDKKILSVEKATATKYSSIETHTSKPFVKTTVITDFSNLQGILIQSNQIPLTINYNGWLSIFEYNNQCLLFALSSPYRTLNLLKLIDSFRIEYRFTNNNYQPVSCPQPTSNNQYNTGYSSSASSNDNTNPADQTSSNGSNNDSSNSFNSGSGSGNGGKDNDNNNNNHSDKADNVTNKQKKKKKKKKKKNEYNQQELLNTISQQRQFIASLQKSHQTLITIHTNPVALAMRAMQDANKYKQENEYLKSQIDKLQKLINPMNKDKKKKKKARRQTKRIEMELKNDAILNNEPQSSLRAKGNVHITRQFTDNSSSQVEKHMSNLYNYLDKFTAMINVETHNEKNNEHSNFTIMDYELHDKHSHEKLYCILETQDPTLKCNRGYKLKMKNKLFTQRELSTEFNICQKELPLPITFHTYFRQQLQCANTAKELLSDKSKMFPIIDNIMWQKVSVLTKRDPNRRVTLALTTTKFKKNMKIALTKVESINLSPIIMFKNDKYFVNTLWIVRIDENVDIGISFGYNIKNKNIVVTAIHMNKTSIIEQIQLIPIEYRNIKAEKYLDEFTSNVTHLSIGNPQDAQNTINNYKLKYEKLKQFTETFSETDSINAYEQLKLNPKILLHNNTYNCNYLSSPTITNVPFGSESAMSRNESISLSSTSSLCGYPFDHK